MNFSQFQKHEKYTNFHKYVRLLHKQTNEFSNYDQNIKITLRYGGYEQLKRALQTCKVYGTASYLRA